MNIFSDYNYRIQFVTKSRKQEAVTLESQQSPFVVMWLLLSNSLEENIKQIPVIHRL